ncbi:7845_t:CDS:2, partial [Funneliformis geosporum]
YGTLMATFYILSDNKTGVVVIPNVIPSDNDMINQLFELQTGLNILEERGVTNLVLDFHDNGGGFILLAYFFVYLLFPEFSPSFDNDMVVTELSRALLEAATSQSTAFKTSNKSFEIPPSLHTKDLIRWAANTVLNIMRSTSIFDTVSYKDPNTGNPFINVEEFIGNKTYQGTLININGRVEMLFINRWVSCSLITHRMAEKFNVSTIAVGGYKDKPLSYASFPGSQVLDFDELYYEFNSLGILQNETLKELIPPPFKVPIIFTITLKEIYDIFNEDYVLEYTYKPAKHRLYYDEKSAKDP